MSRDDSERLAACNALLSEASRVGEDGPRLQANVALRATLPIAPQAAPNAERLDTARSSRRVPNGHASPLHADQEDSLADTGVISISLDFSVTTEPELSDIASPAAPAPPSGPPGRQRNALDATLIAGRYQLGKVLGEGGFGAVYRAHDRISGDEVAVKVLHVYDPEEAFRFRAEVSVLRLLRLPALVHLLDDGLHEGRPFLVTELVAGTPFPGVPAPATWEEMEQPTIGLLEALARVHAHGVVHRDLKPANVLVRSDGTPVLLDFGVAFGPGFSQDGDKGMVVGTPAFLAPEQASGSRGDVRSDIYALGAMLYEALTGRLPHEANTLRELLGAKLNKPVKPLVTYAPDTPFHVAAAIDACLRTEPEQRPPSVSALLLMLGVKPSVEHLPRLGPAEILHESCRLLRSGQSLVTSGARGLGHTRLLADIESTLTEEGVEVLRVLGSRQRWGSLPLSVRRAVGRVTDASEHTVVQLLRDARERGAVFVADDAARVDEATLEALNVARVTTMWAGSQHHDLPAVTLTRLAADDLRPLFHGPDLLLHLREDASRLLHQSTGGVPRRIVRTLDAWVKSGLCYWEGDKLRITREALDRIDNGMSVAPDLEEVNGDDEEGQLLSWISVAGAQASRDFMSHVLGETADELSAKLDGLIADGRLIEDSASGLFALGTGPKAIARATGRRNAHGIVGAASPAGTPGRLLHLIQARDVDRVVEEAAVLAASALRGRRLSAAFAAVREAIAFVRVAEKHDAEAGLLRWLALLAIDLHAERYVDIALYEVERGREHTGALAHLAQLLDATRIVKFVERDKGRALSVARAVPEFADVWLERNRRALQMIAGVSLSADELIAEAERNVAWADAHCEPFLAARVYGWLGNALYRCGRFEEAAEAHMFAATGAGGTEIGAAALTNAASAYLEAGELTRAREAANRALANAARAAMLACRASWLVRSIATRSGNAPTFDDELLAAYRLCGDPDTRAKGFEVEAAIAWRAGAYGRARQLAEVAYTDFEVVGRSSASTLMRCLQTACDAKLGAPFVENVPLDPVQLYPRLYAQACVLKQLSGTANHEERDALWRSLEHKECMPGRGGLVWEVLSRDECVATIRSRK